MGNVNFKDYDTITMNYDDGTKEVFKFSDTVELNNDTYAILEYYEDDTLICIYKIDDMESVKMSPLEDEEIEKQVLDIYYKRQRDLLNKQKTEKVHMSWWGVFFSIVLIITLITVLVILPKLWNVSLAEIGIPLILMLIVGMFVPAMFLAIIPTSIICAILGIEYETSESEHNPNFSWQTYRAQRDLEEQARKTKDPVLRAQLNGQAEYLRKINK